MQTRRFPVEDCGAYDNQSLFCERSPEGHEEQGHLDPAFVDSPASGFLIMELNPRIFAQGLYFGLTDALGA